MKRRQFIKAVPLAGAGGALAQGCSPMSRVRQNEGPGFDVHPFVKNNPEAVFIALTDVPEKTDADALHDSAYSLSKELIVPVESGGYPYSSKVVVKPNWTATRQRDQKPVTDILGVNTDPHFVEGFMHGMENTGARDFYLRECASPDQWEPMGYRDLAERNGYNLRDLSSKDYWELDGDDVNFVEIPDGVMFREMGFMAPVNERGTFLVNIAKMKAHGMGITASIKNLQGVTSAKFHRFCNRYDSIRGNGAYNGYLKYFRDDFELNIEHQYAGHMKMGIPRWSRPGNDGGIWMETWVQRMLDAYSVTPTGINIVEGVYSQDGNGFGSGPHPKGPDGFTSRDYLSNIVIFGMNPFRVDIVTHWLAGHEPGNFGLFHIGIERGMSNVLDPFDIPVYSWKNGRAELVPLDSFNRTPLVTYYLQRDYDGLKEPEYHLCNEPFDYSAWKAGKPATAWSPSARPLGTDAQGRPVIEVAVPEKDNVHVEVLNNRGELIWKLRAPDLPPGKHQVVWDGFDQPGVYNVYVRGMEWDEKRRMVLYPEV